MSMVEDLGARLRTTADELPLDAVMVAYERLRVATDLLAWVRRESANPIGVPQLAHATEHLEQAGYALRVGQDTIDEYLAAIGLGYAAAGRPPPGPFPDVPTGEERAKPEAGEVTAPVLRHWWSERVEYLAGRRDSTDGDNGTDGAGPDRAGGTTDHRSGGRETPTPRPSDRATGPRSAARKAAADSRELLRRVADRVRDDDPDGVRDELLAVEAPVGLGLSAISPPLLRDLATDLLGHQPTGKDLPVLVEQTRQPARKLMPRVPDEVLETLLARVCRVPEKPAPEKRGSAKPAPEKTGSGRSARDKPGSGEPAADGGRPEPPHPTDSAVAAALLTGVLLHRLSRDPDTLRPDDDKRRREPAHAGRTGGTRDGGGRG